jgi:predicted  nucleic acid-binding Zn-ribbon protein
MCKKLFLAAAAILIGTAVVRHTSLGSLAQVWWSDAKKAVEGRVPPEVQIRQLGIEVGKIDRDIKQNLSKLAAQEVDCQNLEENVASLRQNQVALKADITSMTKTLDAGVERTSFKGHSFTASDLAKKLDRSVTLYQTQKTELQSKEQLLAIKKQALEAAHARISAMHDKKEQLSVTVAELETRLQVARLNATRNDAGVDLDDSQVARCTELANEINKRLAVEEKTQAMYAQYGYSNPIPKVEENRPTADILQSAKKAIAEDEAGDRIVDKK